MAKKNSTSFLNLKVLLLTLLIAVPALAMGYLLNNVVHADTLTTTVNACVDANGALRIAKKNDTCKKNETTIELTTGNNSGNNGYFGLPFIASGTDLSSVASKFAGEDFSNAIMRNDFFNNVSVQGVIFRNAYLSTSGFDGSDLSNADFSNADLSLVSFNQTNLTNANFTNTNLDQATNMETATVTGVIWNNTTCPDGTNSNNDSNTCADHFVYHF
jgi:uncharacterized protein YjbI with pentapeptide repeats